MNIGPNRIHWIHSFYSIYAPFYSTFALFTLHFTPMLLHFTPLFLHLHSILLHFCSILPALPTAHLGRWSAPPLCHHPSQPARSSPLRVKIDQNQSKTGPKSAKKRSKISQETVENGRKLVTPASPLVAAISTWQTSGVIGAVKSPLF